MKVAALLLAVLGTVVSQVSASAIPVGTTDLETRSINCAKPAPNTCSFYPDCLEAKVHCGSSGYPIGYGLKYCDAFTKARPTMSILGQEWVTKTMLCLQDGLVPYATGAKKAGTCANLKAIAFNTHPGCYVEGGVCLLPPSDWAIIVKTVSLPTLFGSWDSVLQSLRTIKDCGEFYEYLIKEGVVKVVHAAEDGVKDIWHDVTSWF